MGTTLSKSAKKWPNVGSFLTYDEIKEVVASGDLIEIQRKGYKHWVICESNNQGTVWCYHVSSINSRAKNKVYVRYEPLIDILVKEDGTEGWDVCRVNNQEREADKTGLIARPLDQVFEELRTLVDQKVEYDLNLRNCEYYCTLWKYGIGWSQQVYMTELKVMAGIMGVGTCTAVGGLLGTFLHSYMGSSEASFGTYDEMKLVVKRGDLIEIQRPGYKHWVICESSHQGTVWCYHVAPVANI
uniref:LRAT domain-containing protein n=1 Tax=Oppiella nova TaxID=334625 RepID=A0A7R9M238_9ACAR|nr:unnamed protein product [Oppiella nova]CAG2169279.1 unnamed protein product [Oppiella nova]